jgi:hypothetical protein
LGAGWGGDEKADVGGIRFEVGFADEVLGLPLFVPDYHHRLIRIHHMILATGDRATGEAI